MPRKIVTDREQPVEEEYEWNKKRLVIAGFCAIVLLSIGGLFISTFLQSTQGGKKVLGASDSANIKDVQLPDGIELPTKEKLEQMVDGVKFGLSHMTSNKFSSQSAITKIVVGVQQIQKGKKNVIDLVCDFFCKKK